MLAFAGYEHCSNLPLFTHFSARELWFSMPPPCPSAGYGLPCFLSGTMAQFAFAVDYRKLAFRGFRSQNTCSRQICIELDFRPVLWPRWQQWFLFGKSEGLRNKLSVLENKSTVHMFANLPAVYLISIQASKSICNQTAFLSESCRLRNVEVLADKFHRFVWQNLHFHKSAIKFIFIPYLELKFNTGTGTQTHMR
jgi:hypothetical protein